MAVGHLTAFDKAIGNIWPLYDVFDGLTQDLSIDFFRTCEEEAWQLYGASPLYVPTENLFYDPNASYRALMTRDGEPYAHRFPTVAPSMERKVRVYPYWTLCAEEPRDLAGDLYVRLLEWKKHCAGMERELPFLQELEQLCRRWLGQVPPLILDDEQKKRMEDVRAQLPALGDPCHIESVLDAILTGLRQESIQMHVLGEFLGKSKERVHNTIVLYLANIVDAWRRKEKMDGFDFNDYVREIVAHEMFHFIHFQMVDDAHPDPQRHWFAPAAQAQRATVQECLALCFEMVWLRAQRVRLGLIAKLVLQGKNRLDYPAWPYASIRACRWPYPLPTDVAGFSGRADPKEIFEASFQSWSAAYHVILKGDPFMYRERGAGR